MRMWPASRAGRLAGGLALAFLLWVAVVGPLLDLAWDGADPSLGPLNLLGAVAFVLAVAAAAVALVALVRRQDRALTVWLSLVPGAFVVLFELGELVL